MYGNFSHHGDVLRESNKLFGFMVHETVLGDSPTKIFVCLRKLPA